MRSFDMFLIKLPKGLGGDSALAVGTALVSAANVQPSLAPTIVDAKVELEVANVDLAQALSDRLGTSNDPMRAVRADRLVDTGWVSIHHFMTAWAPIPGHGVEAQRVLDVIYPNGLAFLKLPFKAEWSESETRFARMKEEGFDKLIEKLGGKAILAFAESAQAEFGEALGITAQVHDEPKLSVRETLDAQLEAMRFYALQVMATVRRADPKTQDLADVLLKPLATFEAPTKSEPSESTDETPSTGDANPTGTPV